MHYKEWWKRLCVADKFRLSKNSGDLQISDFTQQMKFSCHFNFNFNHKVGTGEKINFEKHKNCEILGFTFGREIVIIVRQIGLLYFWHILLGDLVTARTFVTRMECSPVGSGCMCASFWCRIANLIKSMSQNKNWVIHLFVLFLLYIF